MSAKTRVAGSVGKGMVRILWDETTLFMNLDNASPRFHRDLQAVMQAYAPKCEAHMKVNAPWNDQTGNARQGLGARAFQEGTNHGIVLFHSVPYGIWLEVRFNGRNAIIGPTIEQMGPQVMAACRDLLRGVNFSS